MPRQDFYVTFGSDIDQFNAGLLKELKRTEQIVANFEKTVGNIGAGAANSPLAKLLGRIEAAKGGAPTGGNTGTNVPQANEVTRALHSLSTDINKLVGVLNREGGTPSLRDAPATAATASVANVRLDDAPFARVAEAVDRNVTATVRVEAAIDRLIVAVGGRNAAARPAPSKPAETVQPRTQEQWDALSANRRNRLVRAGVTPETYLSGQQLPRFRGQDAAGKANATPATAATARNVNDLLGRILAEVTGFRADVRARVGTSKASGKATEEAPKGGGTASPTVAQAATSTTREFATTAGRAAYLDQLKRTHPELAKMVAGENKLAAAVALVTKAGLTQRQAIDLLGDSFAKTRKEAGDMLGTALGGARLESKAAELARAAAEAERRALQAKSAPQDVPLVEHGPARPTEDQWTHIRPAGPAAPTNAQWKVMQQLQRQAAVEADRNARSTRDATRIEEAYQVVIGRVSTTARTLVDDLGRLRRAGASDTEMTRAQAAAYAQLNRELAAKGFKSGERKEQIGAAFAGVGASATQKELTAIARNAAATEHSDRIPLGPPRPTEEQWAAMRPHGPAAPTTAEQKAMEAAQRRLTAETDRNNRAIRDATLVETSYQAVMGRVSSTAQRLIADLGRLRAAGASEAEITRAQVAAYVQLNRELAVQNFSPGARKKQIGAAFAGVGAPTSGTELSSVARSAAVIDVGPTSRTAQAGVQQAGQTGQRIGAAMGYQASSALGQLMFGNTSPFARIAHTTGTFIVRNFAAGAVFGVTNALQEAVRQGVETESEFIRVSSALDATGRSSDGLRTQLQALSQQYGVSLEGIYKTAAGLTGLFGSGDTNNEQLVSLTKVAVQLEIISGGALNAQEAMRSLASVTAAYGDSSASQIADVATVIQNQLGVNVEDTIEGVSRLSGMAKEMGISFQHAAAYVASIGKLTGQSGTAAGEQFSRILESLQTGRTQNVISRALGSHGIDANGAIVAQNYDEVLQLLLEHYTELSKAEQANVATALGGSRQAAAINALLSDGAKVLDTATKATHANGDAQERAQAIADSLRNKMNRASTAFVNFFAVLVRAHVLDAFGAALWAITGALDTVNHMLSVIQDFFESSPLLSTFEQYALVVGGLALSFNLLAKAWRGFMAVAGGSALVRSFAAGAAGRGAAAGEGAAVGGGAGAASTASNAALAASLVAGRGLKDRYRFYNPVNTPPLTYGEEQVKLGAAGTRTFAVGGAGEAVLLGATATQAPRGRLAGFYEARAASLGQASKNAADRALVAADQRRALTQEIIARQAAGAAATGELGARGGLVVRQGVNTAVAGSTKALSTGLSFMAANAGALTGGLLVAAAAILAFKAGVDSFAMTAKEYDTAFRQYFGEGRNGGKKKTDNENQVDAFQHVLKDNKDQNHGWSGLWRGFSSNLMHPLTSADEVTAQNVGRIPVKEATKLATLNGVLTRQLNKYSAGLKRAKPEDVQKAIAENNKNIELYAEAIDARPDLSKAQKANILLQLSKMSADMSTQGEQRMLVAQGLHAVDALSSDQIANIGSVVSAINGLGDHVRGKFQDIIKAWLEQQGFDPKGKLARQVSEDLQDLTRGYSVKRVPLSTVTRTLPPASKPNLRPGTPGTAPGAGGSLAPMPTDQRGNVIPTDKNGDPIFPSIGPNGAGPTISGTGTLPIAPTKVTTTQYKVVKTKLSYEARSKLTQKTLEDALNAANAAIKADKGNQNKIAQDTANAINAGQALGQSVAQGLQDQVDKANQAMAHAERSGHFGNAVKNAEAAIAAIKRQAAAGQISPWAAQAALDQLNTQLVQDEVSKATAAYEDIKVNTRDQRTLLQNAVDEANKTVQVVMNDPRSSKQQKRDAKSNAYNAANALQDFNISANETAAAYQEMLNTPRGDAVGQAANRLKDDRRRLDDMAAQGLKNSAEYNQQLMQIKQDEYSYADSLTDVTTAQYTLAEAIADANGYTVKAARIRMDAADRALKKARADSGGKNTAAVRNAAAASVQQHAAYRDAKLQDELDTIDFNRQMGYITSAAAIQELQHILDTEKLTKARRHQILLEIHGLQQDLVSQLTSSGFNIPGTVQLPTAYQVRRSLGIDHARTLVKNSIDDYTNAMKPNALTGGNSSASLVNAMNSVRDAVNAKGAQHIKVDQKNNYHVPTAAVARQIADQIIGLINQQNGQHVRANTSTPRLVQTR